MAQLVKFVDSIAASPTVRLDLHDKVTWACDRDTSFPPPPLRRTVVETLLLDGARIPATAYSNRVINLSLALFATTADLQAAEIQKLARELDRQNNILMWQPDTTTNPIFFRTFRSELGEVVEQLYNQRHATVQVLAEPFGYGIKTTLGAVTVANNPVSANGCLWDVTGIKGDVETPVVLSMAANAVYDATKKQSLYAVRRRGTPSSAPFLAQAEAATQGTNTTTQANDATYSGTSNNFSRCTFTTATNALRLTIPAPTDAVDLRGTYRLWMRYKRSSGTGVILVQAKWNGAVYTNDQVALATSALFRWADLGLISAPSQPDPKYDGFSNVEQSVSGLTIEIWAERDSGTSTLDFDFFLYVPADDSYCIVKWSSVNSSSYKAILDGVADSAYVLDAGNALENVGATELVGGLPMLTPNQTNRIVFLRDVGTTSGASDAITGTTDITLSYWPRYLYIRPATT